MQFAPTGDKDFSKTALVKKQKSIFKHLPELLCLDNKQV